MNKKNLLSLSLSIGLAFSSMAIPAKQGVRTVVQPDGSQLSLNRIGDERAHSDITIDGLSVSRQADGFYYYRSGGKVTKMRASDPGNRSVAEEAFIEKIEKTLVLQKFREPV